MAELVSVCASAHAPMMLAARDAAPLEQRESFFDATAHVRDEIKRSGVDSIVVVSNEHFTNFFYENFPAFCLGVGEHHVGPVERWLGVPETAVPGDPMLAAALLDGLFEHGFEPAVSHRLRLDHGIVTVYHEAAPSMDLPLVPFIVNCAVKPMPSLRRCYEMGRALASTIRASELNRKVAILGAGGLSHAVGTPQVGTIDPEFDRWFLEQLRTGDIDAICAVPDDEIEVAGNGAHEIRAWLVAAGAAAPARAEVLAYEPIAPWITGMGVVRFDLDAIVPAQ